MTMQSWLAKRVLSWIMRRLREGDIGPAMLLDAPDVVLTFPGDSSFSGVFRGKEAHRQWEARFARCGFQIWPDQVVASGPPWRTTVAVRGHDLLRSPEGELVYENRYVIWGRLRWGRMKELEVYEDTLKTRQVDDWLADNEHRLAAA
jgi:ketosteroid isomerase-like protein